MAEPQVKGRIRDAVTAAGAVAEQGRAVARAVPQRVQGEDERVRAAVSTASDSLRSVAAFARTINPDFSVPIRLAGPPAEQLSLEARYRAARGHDPPQRFMRNLFEARAHSQEEERGARDVLRNISGREVAPGRPPIPAADERQAPPGSAERLSLGVAGWFGADALGPALAARFARSRPVVTSESPPLFEFYSFLGGSPLIGIYHPDTNHISINADRFGKKDMTDADRMQVLAHEMFHYASFLGGSHNNMRWRDANGRPFFANEGGLLNAGRVAWLDEGLTELHAQQLTRSHGHRPTHVSYEDETTAAFYLQQLAGADVLRNAYLTGEYTEVRRRVDSQLGDGAFAAIMDAGSGLGAMHIIRDRMDASGLSARLASWDRNPIVRLAGAVEGYLRAEAERREAEREPGQISSTHR